MTFATFPPASALVRANHLLAHDPAAALANYTWINNVTVGAPYCDFAFADDDHCLARHRALPFPAISIDGHDPAIIARLIDELIENGDLPPELPFYSLISEQLAQVLAAAAEVLSVQSEWQMLYDGEPDQLDPGSARLLTPDDLPAMTALAQVADSMVFSADTFARGEFFGVDCDGELVAMGGVQTNLPGFTEIGSIATHPKYRRRGYASQVVTALVHHLKAQGQQVFLVLFQTNTSALALYRQSGFEIVNKLQLIRWQAGAKHSSSLFNSPSER